MAEDILKDKTLICKDCHRRFLFSVNEQKDFGQKGYPDPVRCHECRRQKKIIKNLNDGVLVGESFQIKEQCDWCGRPFNAKFRRTPDTNLFCGDCWDKIMHEKFWEKIPGLGESKA